MKHNFKLVVALALVAMMVASMMTGFAALPSGTITPEGSSADTSITITGLNDNDDVTLYQVIKWSNNANNTSAGWVLTSDFAGADSVLQKINASVDQPYALTQADVKVLTDIIKTNGFSATPVSGDGITSGTYTATVDPGLYIALVKPAVAGTLYNPIIVSADWETTNGTDTIDSSARLGVAGENKTIVKKETITLEKTQDDDDDATDNSFDVGDNVSFTVTTTIPTWADVYKNPSFVVSDTLSTGLVLDATRIKVYQEDGSTEITALTSAVTASGTSGWTLNVPSTYLTAMTQPENIVIKYEATLTETAFKTVNEEVNKVTVQFSNNPNNDSDAGKMHDKTRSYTFTIDGEVLGKGGIHSSEVIKVAVDGNGNPIYQSSSTNSTYTNALAGAEFGLFTDSDCEDAYTNVINGTTKNWGSGIMSNDKGELVITGLDVGTYYLKELTAPTGYIKDQSVHTIDISATYGTETVVEDGWTYTLPVLESYTITVDGKNTRYSMTLQASEITTSDVTASDSLLNNTKGIELPSTGGIGTTIFYVGGSLMVLAAAILLITKRRMGVED